MPQKCLLSGIGVETILYVAFELHTIKLFLRLLWYKKIADYLASRLEYKQLTLEPCDVHI